MNNYKQIRAFLDKRRKERIRKIISSVLFISGGIIIILALIAWKAGNQVVG
jgi:hypothetical protein